MVVGLLCAATAVYAAVSVSASGDYSGGGGGGADNAGPSIAALAHGHAGRFFADQPLMGLSSLILRAPVVWASDTLGGGSLAGYRWGALLCLLPVAGLAAWTLLRARAAGVAVAGLIAAGIILLGPQSTSAIALGHPEEALTATPMTASILAATRGRAMWAGLLLGAAVGTKDWAIIGVAPLLVALDHGRVRAMVVAGGTAALLCGLPAVVDPSAFHRAGAAMSGSRGVTAFSGWWLIGLRPAAMRAGSPLAGLLPFHLTRGILLPFAILTASVVVALAARVRRRNRERGTRQRRQLDPFAVLCLLAVVRCIADPVPLEYYFLAVLVPLAVWEAGVLHRVPVAALLTMLAVDVSFGSGTHLSATSLNLLILAWSLGLAVYLTARGLEVGRPAAWRRGRSSFALTHPYGAGAAETRRHVT
jgi:hypothetical protein